MVMLTGDVVPTNKLDPMFHAVGKPVLVKQGKSLVGSGEVADDDTFAIELPDDLTGELEIELGMPNAAPCLVVAEGNDMHVTVLYSNVNNFLV